MESLNPFGSIKDRVGLKMIQDAENQGLIKEGSTIIESTAGNTGLGLALAAKLKGYKLILVIPDKMSEEKIRHLEAMGVEIIMTRSDVDPWLDEEVSIHPLIELTIITNARSISVEILGMFNPQETLGKRSGRMFKLNQIRAANIDTHIQYIVFDHVFTFLPSSGPNGIILNAPRPTLTQHQ